VPAALAATAVPATADAATITTSGTKDGTTLHYRARQRSRARGS
jgi:hypothetical protein